MCTPRIATVPVIFSLMCVSVFVRFISVRAYVCVCAEVQHACFEKLLQVNMSACVIIYEGN